jgi:23S rRNA pseudouridine1911/1915/1917 synthase
VRAVHPELSWTRVRAVIVRGQVTVDGAVARDPGLEVTAAQAVQLDLNRPAGRVARAAFPILYEDDDVIVLDKPPGLLTIPSAPGRTDEDTVLARVRDYMARKHGEAGYVGTLHRLDRDTSGAIALALSRQAHEAGREVFGRHGFERRYVAVVSGIPEPAEGVVDAPIALGYAAGRRRLAVPPEPARDAVTRYRVVERFPDSALVELVLETGRQHQIRLHLASLGHPVLGDQVYGPASSAAKAPRQMLHARTLEFPHPLTGARVAVEAPIPTDMARVMRQRAARR